MAPVAPATNTFIGTPACPSLRMAVVGLAYQEWQVNVYPDFSLWF